MLNFIRKIELVLFYLFIFSIPLEKRHVFETATSRIDGHFIEWNSAALYLSDILFGLLLLFWIINIIFSAIKRQKTKNQSFKNLIIIFLTFILISLVSAINSDFVKLSLYHLTKILEYGLILLYIIKNTSTIKKIIYTLLTFIVSGFLQAILGIIQYLKQSSLNLKILGEVDLNPFIQNVAKIDLDGEKYIRAYGTFPHSNVLAFFLFITIIFTITLILIILNKESISKKSSSYSKIEKMFHVEHLPLFILNKLKYFIKLPIFIFILYVLTLGLILTFSRTAWLALVISFIFIISLIIFTLSETRKTLINKLKKNFHTTGILILFVLFMTITILIFWSQINSRRIDVNPQDDYSISGRKLYSNLAVEAIRDNFILGVGPGLFVNYFNNDLSKNFAWWQLQPVHNVYLLILAENGVLGFIVFIIFILHILSNIKKVNFKQKGDIYINQILIISLASLLFSFFIIMLFDHYLWTIQQGALCFWMILGLFYSSIKLNYK